MLIFYFTFLKFTLFIILCLKVTILKKGFMKYYKRSVNDNHFENFSISDLSSQFSTTQKTIENSLDYYEIDTLSQELIKLFPNLQRHLYFTYVQDTFEKIYKVRFCLLEEEFCQLQEFLFAYNNNKGSSPVVPHLDTFYHSISNNFFKEESFNISEDDKSSLVYFYRLAKNSENHNFFTSPFQEAHNIYNDYKDYLSSPIKELVDFILFSKHLFSLNFFKYFLHSPEMMDKDNFPLILKLVDTIKLVDNENPRINEINVFSKLMEQKHWIYLSKLKNEGNYLPFLEKIFFYHPGLLNSQGFLSSPVKKIHFLKYDVLTCINNKKIDLNCLFDSTTTFPNFSSFVSHYINEKIKNSQYAHDEEGLEVLKELLKTQSYFYLNNKLYPKGLLDKITKI